MRITLTSAGTSVLLAFALLFFCSCRQPTEKTIPTAENGILDLREWDFEKDGNVNLTGEWEFCYKAFIRGSNFDSLSSKFFLEVPGTWDKHYWKNECLGIWYIQTENSYQTGATQPIV